MEEKLEEQWKSESYYYPTEFNTLEDLASLLDQVILGQVRLLRLARGLRSDVAIIPKDNNLNEWIHQVVQSVWVRNQEGIRSRNALNLTSGSPSTLEMDIEGDEEMEMAIREHKRAFARLDSFRETVTGSQTYSQRLQGVAPPFPGATEWNSRVLEVMNVADVEVLKSESSMDIEVTNDVRSVQAEPSIVVEELSRKKVEISVDQQTNSVLSYQDSEMKFSTEKNLQRATLPEKENRRGLWSRDLGVHSLMESVETKAPLVASLGKNQQLEVLSELAKKQKLVSSIEKNVAEIIPNGEEDKWPKKQMSLNTVPEKNQQQELPLEKRKREAWLLVESLPAMLEKMVTLETVPEKRGMQEKKSFLLGTQPAVYKMFPAKEANRSWVKPYSNRPNPLSNCPDPAYFLKYTRSTLLSIVQGPTYSSLEPFMNQFQVTTKISPLITTWDPGPTYIDFATLFGAQSLRKSFHLILKNQQMGPLFHYGNSTNYFTISELSIIISNRQQNCFFQTFKWRSMSWRQIGILTHFEVIQQYPDSITIILSRGNVGIDLPPAKVLLFHKVDIYTCNMVREPAVLTWDEHCMMGKSVETIAHAILDEKDTIILGEGDQINFCNLLFQKLWIICSKDYPSKKHWDAEGIIFDTEKPRFIYSFYGCHNCKDHHLLSISSLFRIYCGKRALPLSVYGVHIQLSYCTWVNKVSALEFCLIKLVKKKTGQFWVFDRGRRQISMGVFSSCQPGITISHQGTLLNWFYDRGKFSGW